MNLVERVTKYMDSAKPDEPQSGAADAISLRSSSSTESTRRKTRTSTTQSMCYTIFLCNGLILTKTKIYSFILYSFETRSQKTCSGQEA